MVISRPPARLISSATMREMRSMTRFSSGW